MRALVRRRERIQELLSLQERLKMDLADAKNRLMIDKNTWSFDCEYHKFESFPYQIVELARRSGCVMDCHATTWVSIPNGERCKN